MWLPLTVTIGYLVVGFVVFRTRYTRERAKTLLWIHEARAQLAKAEEARKAAKKVTSRGYSDYSYESAVTHASRSLENAKQEWRINSDLPQSIFCGALWFIYIFIGLGKLAYKVLFKGDIDAGANKMGKQLIAKYDKEMEKLEEHNRLKEIAKEEGLL